MLNSWETPETRSTCATRRAYFDTPEAREAYFDTPDTHFDVDYTSSFIMNQIKHTFYSIFFQVNPQKTWSF